MESPDAKKPFFGLRGGWLTFWLTVACATDMTLFGYDQGVFSGVTVTQDFLELHDLVGPSRTQVLSTVTAIYDIGCFFGAIAAFTCGERLGRKKAILLGTTIMAIGTIIKASSYSLAQMFVGRIVLGYAIDASLAFKPSNTEILGFSIGNGINTTTAPVWQTETAHHKWRGKLVIFELVMNIAGFSLVNWINYGLSFRGGAVAWRFPIAFQFFFILILFATVPWLPESPRWLMEQGREEEAVEILAAIEDKPVTDSYILTQRNEIRFSVQYERENAPTWTELFLRKKGTNDTKSLRRLLLGAGTQFMQQFEGINIMSYYMPLILINAVGLSESMARLLSACNSVSYLLFTCLAVPLVERWGRRGLMLFSTAGQGFSFLVITILLRYAETSPDKEKIASASIAFFFLYFIAFGMGMLGVPWLYPTEINSLPMRNKGAAVATATNWMTNFVVVEITPIGIQNIGWRFWIVWTIFNAGFLPVIYFLYPETANRTLEDLDSYYRTNPSLVVIGDPDATCVKRPLKYIQHEDEELQKNAKGVSMEVEEVIKSDPETYS